jgi:hypothetical protein
MAASRRTIADISKNKISGQSFTNPYTLNASVLSLVYANVVNDSADFIGSTESVDPLQAEIQCIRLQTDTVLYPARLCEALIKQLLHLTSFPEHYYRRTALGALLSQDCPGCRQSNTTPHQVSLLGSLAHRYRLCHEFEDCLQEHMKLVKQRRDFVAAHAGTTKFTGKSLAAVRKDFGKEFTKHTKIFIHMLEHISEIEDKMFWELRKTLPPDFKIILRVGRRPSVDGSRLQGRPTATS